MLTKRYTQAFQLAAQLHQTQQRKGTKVPYLSHLMAVSSLVLEYSGTEDEAIAGLLHDAVEDQGGQATLQTIREQFGDAVAEIVWAVSDTDVQPKPAWKVRKEIYIAHAREATSSARLVSACDKLHNLRSILRDYLEQGEGQWARFVPEAPTLAEKRDMVIWYYSQLTQVYLEVGPAQVGRELKRTLEALLEATQTSAG
jgi:(p)ppGpp synthase/HD superfamily hydrolase